MVKVLSIIGAGRSGSTVLSDLIGTLPGFFSAGELRHIWNRGVVWNQRCACGLPVLKCDIWAAVLADLLGGDAIAQVAAESEDLPDAQAEHRRLGIVQEILTLRRAALAAQPRLVRMSRRRRVPDPESVDRYGTTMAALYRSICDVTGARVVVDASKVPADAVVNGSGPDVKQYVVHLVRDARGVAYSQTRVVPDPSREDRQMPRHSVRYSGSTWVKQNLAAELIRLKRASRPSLLLRYEDLIADPPRAVSEIAALVEEPIRHSPVNYEGEFLLEGSHSVSGNPSRFRAGQIRLVQDDEWIEALPTASRRILTAMTLPLLLRYRYPARVNMGRKRKARKPRSGC